MNYKEKSNFEINKAVAEKLGKFDNPDLKMVASTESIRYQSYEEIYNYPDSVLTYTYDPVRSWADAGPIIERYNISMIQIPIIGSDKYRYMASIGAEFMTVCMSPEGSDNGALTYTSDMDYIDEDSPTRAACIVFLMMEDE